MRPPDARYLHEQNAFEQPGARATAGDSALVRRSGQPRSKENFVRHNIGTRATAEFCFPPGNIENRNPELALRQPQAFASLSPAKNCRESVARVTRQTKKRQPRWKTRTS